MQVIYSLLGKQVKSKKLPFTGCGAEYNEIKTQGLLQVGSEEVNSAQMIREGQCPVEPESISMS